MQEQGWDTVAYAKPHIGGVEQSRIDFGDFNRLNQETANRLIDIVEKALPRLDALVINAQARSGLHDAYLRPRLAALIKAHPDCLYTIDTREPLAMYAGGILKLNDIEASRVCGLPVPPRERVPHQQACAAARALAETRHQPVFVTCGPDGMVVCDQHGLSEIDGIPHGGEIRILGFERRIDRLLDCVVHDELRLGEGLRDLVDVGRVGEHVASGGWGWVARTSSKATREGS